MAHVSMLESIGLIDKSELPVLLKEMKSIYHQAADGQFVIEDGVEDVHSQVELMLTRKLGDMGRRFSGRSRNDQVLLDMKLYAREQIQDLAEMCGDLFKGAGCAERKYKNVLMPGYTHLQIAMPSSFGLWFGAYAESLVDDMELLLAVWHHQPQPAWFRLPVMAIPSRSTDK